MNAIEKAITTYRESICCRADFDEEELRSRLAKVYDYCESIGMGEQDAGAICLLALQDYQMQEGEGEEKQKLSLLRILHQLKLGNKLKIATAAGFLEDLTCGTAGLEDDIKKELQRLMHFLPVDLNLKRIEILIDYESRQLDAKAKNSRKSTCDAGAHLYFANQTINSGIIFGRRLDFHYEFKNKTARYLLLGEILNDMGTFARLGLQDTWDCKASGLWKNKGANKMQAAALMNWEKSFEGYQNKWQELFSDLMRRL